MRLRSLSVLLPLVAAVACSTPARTGETSLSSEKMIASVRNDRIQFATMRPPGSPFTTLERRVLLIAPPEVVTLAAAGDPAVLDQLVPLLQDPERAWAAEVVLAALTRVDEKIVDTFATQPDEWWRALGPKAFARWTDWLAANRASLTWDAEQKAFLVRPAPAAP